MTIVNLAMDHQEDRQPRYMAFSKMENLLRQMQDSEKGIPVRCQKVFLTTIPSAFTGCDLIEWLMDILYVDEPTEALNIASQLCYHGYIFPVTDTKYLTVKDESSLYRFQSPYFWPSHSVAPDDVEYAIYLAKRSLRNKQRHALEEHEQAAYNNLQKILCDKWDFVYMQAEEQVRLAKDRKKADKVVLDSQERAFWRVHRPMPGVTKCIEAGIARHFTKSQMILRKETKGVEGHRKEIKFLERCLQQPKMKMSKAFESMVHRYEQYDEHDPFLSQPLPSNPWIADDQAFWILNSMMVDNPTERRVKRWAFSLKELLSDPSGVHEFETFLAKEFSSENLKFWLDVENVKKLPEGDVTDKVNEIYGEYIAKGAPREINIDSKTMEETLKGLKNPNRYTFDSAQNHIYVLMKKDSYSRFIRSDQYKNLLTNAINSCPKKKFAFTFGTKKKSPNPSPKSKRRGSAGSSVIEKDTRPIQSSSSFSHHSYSTGNLKELDGPDNPTNNAQSSPQQQKSPKCSPKTSPKAGSPFGSSNDIKAIRHDSERSLSPASIRKKITDLIRGNDRHRKNSMTLEVPQQYTLHSSPESSDNEMDLSIVVPRSTLKKSLSSTSNTSNSKINVVAPWESSET